MKIFYVISHTEREENSMAYSYKCSISFGLVYIPVTLHASVKTQDVGFNMLDKKTMSRVKYKKTCEECDGREVKQEDIVKGYEYEDDKYVVFTEEDFEKLKTKKDKNITIQKFVDIAQIDPIYYDRPYYVNPTGAENAYALLLRAMEEEKKVGIAKTVLGNKETLIALRAKDGQMLLTTLFFADEIQKNPTKEVKAEFSSSELSLAKSIVEGMSGDFKAEDYKDEYRERVKAAIEQKIAGKEIVKAKEGSTNVAANLMEALQASLKGLNNPTKKVSRKAPAVKKEKRA